MASRATDNESSVVKSILSNVCWEENSNSEEWKEDFDYDMLVDIICHIKSSKHAATYHAAASMALDHFEIKDKSARSTHHRLLSKYFKRVKQAMDAQRDASEWFTTVRPETKEIFLYHKPTLSRSESIYTPTQFQLGSVQVENRPCRNDKLIEQHRLKGKETLYRVMSGKM